MGTITKLNDVLCANISKVDGIEKANMLKWDDNTFCPAGPTPTPTPTPTPSPTPTPTPTPTPCPPDCCFVELCYSDRDCSAACLCDFTIPVYLHITCIDDTCTLDNADGIFEDPGCSTPAVEGYYSSGTDCWYWKATDLTLTYQGPC